MKLKFRALLFLLASLLYCVSASAEVGEGFSANNIFYTILSDGDDKTVEMTIVLNQKTDFIMPSTVTGDDGFDYTITSIGSDAFAHSKSIPSITIAESVTSIGSGAFSGCTGLTSIKIPSGVTSIGRSAFSGCTGLTSIEIPSGVTSITSELFSECTELTSIAIPNSVTSIESKAFSGCTGLTSIKIPSGVTSIGDGAFHMCQSLKSIEIPSGVTSIGSNLLYGCWALTEVEIPESVTSIESSAFYGCTSLTSIEIPGTVTTIGDDAFRNCSGITSIVIPSSVTSIGSSAFDGCSSLTGIRMQSATPPTAQATSFSYSYGIATLYVPDSTLTEYQSADNWKSFENIMQYVTHLEIKDGAYTNFNNDNPRYCDTITYTRTLKTDYWNALYLPYEIPVGKILDNGNYEVAYINDVRSYDDNNDGIVDRMAMEIFNITSGTLNANHPYMIKAKSDENNTVQRTMNLVLENTILHTTVSNSLVCSSVYTNFTITGIYEKMTEGTDLEDCLVMSGGKWISMAAGSSLNPFRLYMKIEERGGSPFKVDPAAYARIAIRVIDEDDATGIEDTMHECGAKAEKAVFDISGRKVKNPAKGGVYISDGKIFIN